MDRKQKLELVHLQLTRNCNLRCWFCGQWGREGFFSQAAGTPLSRQEWFAFMGELADAYAQSDEKPSVILWGGEPLCCEFFDEAAEYLFAKGFGLGLVTNGSLLEEHAAVCSKCFCKIYISVDGPPEIHDEIRGTGVFERVQRGRESLGSCQVVVMSVLTEQTEGKIQELVDALSVLRPDEVILQQRIGMTQNEIDRYRRWMQETFAAQAPYIDCWKWEKGDAEKTKLQKQRVEEQLREITAPFPVHFLPHRDSLDAVRCLSPCRHMHIAWNGDVLYCTDFYDLTVGNIRQDGWKDIFCNEKSRLFWQEVQAGRCVTCDHCSWRNSRSFRL